MRAIIVSFAVLLSLPAAALGKGVLAADACGTTECRPLSQRTAMSLMEAGPQIDPPRAAPFYRVRVTVGGGEGEPDFRDRFALAYLPSEVAVRGAAEGGEPVWTSVNPVARRGLTRVTRGLTPLPARRLGPLGSPIRADVDAVHCPACREGAEGAALPWGAGAASLGLLALAGGGVASVRLLRRRRRQRLVRLSAP